MKRKKKKILNDKICTNKLRLIFDRDDADALEELIEAGLYDVNKGDASLTDKEIKELDFCYSLPIRKAVFNLKFNIVKLLLEKGADINKKHHDDDDSLLVDLILNKGHCCDGELHEDDAKAILDMISLLLLNGCTYE